MTGVSDFPAKHGQACACALKDSWRVLSRIGEFASAQRHLVEPELTHFGLKFHVTHATKGKNFRMAQFISYEKLREKGFEEAKAIIERLLNELDRQADAAPERKEAQ